LRPRPARAAPAARRNPPPRGRRRLLADPGRGPLARLRTARAEAAGLAAAEDDLVPAVGGPARRARGVAGARGAAAVLARAAAGRAFAAAARPRGRRQHGR